MSNELTLCRICKEEKPYENFYNTNGKITNKTCKDCMKKAYLERTKDSGVKRYNSNLDAPKGKRYCSICGKLQPIVMFSKIQTSYTLKDGTVVQKEGYSSWCNKCLVQKDKDKLRESRQSEIVNGEYECKECGKRKPLEDFNPSKVTIHGYHTTCKQCIKDRQEEYNKKVNQRDKERRRLKREAWLQEPGYTCHTCGKTLPKKFFNKNSNSPLGIQTSCRICEREARRKQYAQTKESKEETRKKYYNNGDNNTLIRLRTRTNTAIKIQNASKSTGTVALLGCTGKEAYDYLVTLGYDINVHHIDHIVPLSLFDLSDSLHQRVACNYLNLQPLTQEENLKKFNILPDTWEKNIKEIGLLLNEDVSSVIAWFK